jgi:hypothetical protein
MSTVRVVPLCSSCSRDDGGMRVKSGIPRNTMVAPNTWAARPGKAHLRAMAAMSSSDRIDNCRTFRISVPRVYCARTRLSEGRVRPA